MDVWTRVDEYFSGRMIGTDEVLEGALKANRAAGLPDIDVSPLQGRMLEVLARGMGAKRILEIGTLGGYSTICLARGLAAGGKMITLEVNSKHAAVARGNVAKAGFADAVEIREGAALESLPKLAEEGAVFDFVFIDADKVNIPRYVEWALKLSRVGTLIVVDNVVRGGAVVDGKVNDGSVKGVRELCEMLSKEPRVKATAIQTVGVKGHDGFVMAVVVS